MGERKRTVYHGHVEKGIVVLDEPLNLPDGAAVDIVPVKAKSLAERFRGIIGVATGLPRDLAHNHDHYLHGKPKKK